MSLKSFSIIILLIAFSPYTWATDYWISKTGSDSNDCKTEITKECASIQKALSAAVAGDRIYIKAGVYVENSAASAFTKACYWFNGQGSLCVNSSGKKDNPILISAAPNAAKDSVIIDSLNARLGVILQANDYITFRGLTFKNSMKNAIANASQAGNDIADPAYLSVGVIIENCKFYNVSTPDAGDNIAAIGMWSSQDWIVRNNVIDGVNGGSGIRSYGLINALIEHNTIKNVSEGVMWKDHFILNTTTREHIFESEIRYNLITASAAGVLIQIRGTNTPEAGHNYIHHNIFNGFKGEEPGGVRVRMYEAAAQSGNLTVTNNIFDCAGIASCKGVSVDASSRIEVSKNIFVRTGLALEFIKQDAVKIPNLQVSDYNIFAVDKFSVLADRYSGVVKGYDTLASWQSALNNDSVALGFDHPDAHSKLMAYTSSIFLANPILPYLYNSAVMLLDGKVTAGPYELGTEVIGAMSESPSPPLPPVSGKIVK